MANTPIVFPPKLRQTPDGRSYPSICFTYLDNSNAISDWVFLPMPPALEISDSMSYSTLDLGIIGDTITKAIKSAQGGQNALDALKKASLDTGADIYGKITNMNAALTASILARRTGKEGIANTIDFATKQIVAPNTNSTFQGSNIRSFGFKFKMVATEKEGSDTIKRLVGTFREKIYPIADASQLKFEYPGSWKISFDFDGKSEQFQKKYIPDVYRCYLTSFSSSYNASNNMWHEDGAPVEVDISMSFQEVRALSRDDIIKLNLNQDDWT